MHKNKFLIGGLIGMHASSIVYRGNQDNFKPVFFCFCFFFEEKISRAQKHGTKKNQLKNKNKLTVNNKGKTIFHVGITFYVWRVFVRAKSFHQNKIKRLEIIFITSIYYTTNMRPEKYLLLSFPFHFKEKSFCKRK